jgi:NADH-quinone oxidoreductase subunit A
MDIQKLTPETFVFFLLVFSAVGVVFLFIHLLMGSFIRPNVPDAEKLTIYECGEPTVGSAWVQFDLRYYVVALLFVIFDVEVAFFFPWASVYGKLNELATLDQPRIGIVSMSDEEKAARRAKLSEELMPAGLSQTRKENLRLQRLNPKTDQAEVIPIKSEAARSWAQVALLDIAVFFGVLMVGFAYVWRRGDINWIKTYGHHKEPPIEPEKPLEQIKTAAPPVAASH